MHNEDNLQKAREIAKRVPFFDRSIKEPEIPPCNKCGRVIYCGVNKLCSVENCPKKVTI